VRAACSTRAIAGEPRLADEAAADPDLAPLLDGLR
jgi:hypothetical protein